MAFALGPIGQIGRAVSDVDRSDAFYGGILGLRRLFRFGTLSFYDCAGVRLLLDQTKDPKDAHGGSPLYFRVADIVFARRALESRGAVFVDEIHRVAPMEDHDLWMTFFNDPDGHLLGLMMEAPKGYQPNAE